jgi:hypothetical protein
MSQEQFSLFDHQPSVPFVQPSDRLSPSEEFRRDNPDFVELVVERTEWDPNARRAEQLRNSGVGGGLAGAVAGELTVANPGHGEVPVHVQLSTPVNQPRRNRIREPKTGDSELDTDKPLYFGEPQIPTDEEKAIGRAAIEAMRQSGILPPKK